MYTCLTKISYKTAKPVVIVTPSRSHRGAVFQSESIFSISQIVVV